MRNSATAALLALSLLLAGAGAISTESTVPGTGANGNESLLLNGGAEEGQNDMPSIWRNAKVDAQGLKMWRDSTEAHSGKASLAISNTHDYPNLVSNNWAQDLREVAAGKRIVLCAWIKVAGAEAANVCVQCWDESGKTLLAHDSTPVFRGDRDWTAGTSEGVLVPAKTSHITVRAALTGKGKVWFDDISISVLPEDNKHNAEAARELADAVKGRIVGIYPVTKDVMVLKYLPDWSHGNQDNIAIANNDGGVRTLLDWGALPPDAARPGRKFLLALYARRTIASPEPGPIQAFLVRETWEERTSWKNQPKTAEKPAAEFEFTSGEGWKIFDVTAVAQEQLRQPSAFHGVMLRFAKEDFTPQNWSGWAFVSREGEADWKPRRPMLLVVQASENEPKR